MAKTDPKTGTTNVPPSVKPDAIARMQQAAAAKMPQNKSLISTRPHKGAAKKKSKQSGAK